MIRFLPSVLGFFEVEQIVLFDLVVGSLATLGLLYLLYTEIMVVHYQRFFRLITLGLLLYAVTGPIIGTIAPALIHAIHGLAALFIAIGLYDLIRNDIKRESDFTSVFGMESLDIQGEKDLEDD